MVKESTIQVVKKSGDVVAFDANKLYRSLCASGASQAQAWKIIDRIELEAHNGISTKEIYRLAFKYLRKDSRSASIRYKLKDAITELGTTGYPFEKFVCEIFAAEGYKTQNGKLVQGRSILHEIDVIAENDTEIFTIECKYHSNQAAKSDVKVPMYIYSRFMDISAVWKDDEKYKNKTHKQWVVTNTRFTEDAIKFAEDYGIKILSWDYPFSEGLKDIITKFGIFPITCLSSISKQDKATLLAKGIVSCLYVWENMQVLDRVPISREHKLEMSKEISILFQNFFEQKKSC